MRDAMRTPGNWYAEAPNPDADESAGERKTYTWRVRTEYQRKGSSCIGHEVCEVTHLNTGHEEADARLIAAAPELMEALQELLKDMVVAQGNMMSAAKRDSSWEGCAETIQPRIDSARAAIAKATGKPHG